MVKKEQIESIVNYIVSNDVEKIRDCEVYNYWSKSTNIIIREPQDVQYLIEIIRDFKKIKNTRLSKLL